MEDKEKMIVEKINETIEKKVSEVEKKATEKTVEIEKQVAELTEIAKLQGAAITTLKELKEAAKTLPTDFSKGLEKAIERIIKGERKVEIATLSHDDFYQKSAVDMISANVLTGQIPQAVRMPGVNLIPRRRSVLMQYANVFPLYGSNMVEWVEEDTLDGDAGMQTEGQAKSKISSNLKVASAKAEVIAAYVHITKQMLRDVAQLQNKINNDLRYKLERKKETQLLSGNGVTPNINGIQKYAQTLDNAALADTVENAQEFDVIRAAITQIIANSEGNFMPNLIMMNPYDEFRISSLKKSDEGYIFPEFLANGVVVNRIPITLSNDVAVGKYYVMDSTYFNVRPYENVTISLGWINDDFIKNMLVILAEESLCSYVEGNNKEAFIYGDFATDKQFINKAS